MPQHQPRIFLAAGEVSGDARAAELLAALGERIGPCVVQAIAGPRVAAAGAAVVRNLDALHSVRVKELRARRAHWTRLRDDLPHLLRDANPHLVVLVQNPQLNRVVARIARRVFPGVPVVWYMPPEIWAWDFPDWLGRIRSGYESRARVVAETCAAVITVHPFERDAYLPYLPPERVHLVPHPAIDYVTRAVPDPDGTRGAVRGAVGAGAGARVVGLFPGSRRDEVHSLYGLMLAVAARLGDRDLIFVTVAASRKLCGQMQAADPEGRCRVLESHAFLDVLAACDLALLASGTSTLDAAVLGVPHVVLYRLDPLTYVFARAFGRVDWYGLPNIIAGRELCPERRNFRATPGRVARTVRRLLDDPAAPAAIRGGLADVRAALRGPGGIAQAAGHLAAYL